MPQLYGKTYSIADLRRREREVPGLAAGFLKVLTSTGEIEPNDAP